MKALKYKIFALVAVAAFLLFTLIPAPLVLAVTTDGGGGSPASISKAAQRDCYKKFHGHGVGDGTDGKFVGTLQKDYNNGKCDTSKGGNCTVISVQGAIVSCTNPNATTPPPPGSKDDPTTSDDCSTDDKCGIITYIGVITNALSAIVGVVIIAMIIIGGIQYSAAGADPNKVQAAKKKIYNALLALLLFIFGFAIVQWLVPGGIF